MPRPVHPWDTFGSLFSSVNMTSNRPFDGNLPETASSCEELTMGLELQRTEKTVTVASKTDLESGNDKIQASREIQ